jgi:aryl-alcohol dehydrogenase-like predicted oxidoreductase
VGRLALPLARGALAGKRRRSGERESVRAETDAFQDELYGRPEDFDVTEEVEQLAAARGVPRPRSHSRGSCTSPPSCQSSAPPSTATSKMRRAAVDLSLTTEEIARLEASYRPNSVRGHA